MYYVHNVDVIWYVNCSRCDKAGYNIPPKGMIQTESSSLSPQSFVVGICRMYPSCVPQHDISSWPRNFNTTCCTFNCVQMPGRKLQSRSKVSRFFLMLCIDEMFVSGSPVAPHSTQPSSAVCTTQMHPRQPQSKLKAAQQLLVIQYTRQKCMLSDVSQALIEHYTLKFATRIKSLHCNLSHSRW